MKGYIQNESTQAYFIVQRQIPPGGKVELADIYKSVGKQSGLEEDATFVAWLRTDVFTKGTWGFYDHFGKPLGAKKKKAAEKTEAVASATEKSSATTSSKKGKDAVGAGRVLRRDPAAAVAKGTKITPAVIIDAPYDQARTLIEKCTDKSVLKKSLALTKHFAKKEQHMRHILKRLEQVY